MEENWSPPKKSSAQSSEWEAAIDELQKNGGLTREGAIHALKATAHLDAKSLDKLVENASRWAEDLRYNFISAMIMAAQNGFGYDVEPFLGLSREMWGEEQLWDAVKDLPHGPKKRTHVMAAAAAGDARRLDWLIKRGARLELTNTEGRTALWHACNKGRMNAVRALRAKGAKGHCYWETQVDAVDEDGMMPLHIASQKGHLEVVRDLRARGAVVNAARNDGATPLHFAAKNGDLEVVRELIAWGATVEAENENGITPLMVACIGGHEKVAEELLNKEANPKKKDNYGSEPIHFACFSGNLKLVNKLHEVGVDISSKDSLNNTCLHVASKNGKLEVVQILLTLGAEIDAENKNDETPLFLACNGNEEMFNVYIMLKEQEE